MGHSSQHYNLSTALRHLGANDLLPCHRVHHGINEQYLDRNYGGILIIWDKLFGTYEPEGERVRYGLTTQLKTFRPVRVAFHEYIAMWHDMKKARGLRAKAGVAFHGPGWTPPGVAETEATRG